MKEMRSTTQVTKAKLAVKQRILIQSIPKPTRKSYANVPVPAPIASSQATQDAETRESTLAHTHEQRGRMLKRKNMALVAKPVNNPSVEATNHVNRSLQNICIVRRITNRPSIPPSSTSPVLT